MTQTIIRLTTLPSGNDLGCGGDSITIGTSVRITYNDRYVIFQGEDMYFNVLRKEVIRLEAEVYTRPFLGDKFKRRKK